MVGWHHQINGHEFEQAPGDGEEQGSLGCCSPWGFPGKHTRVACYSLLWGNLPDPGIEPHLSYLTNWQARSLPLAPPGKPRGTICSSAGNISKIQKH